MLERVREPRQIKREPLVVPTAQDQQILLRTSSFHRGPVWRRRGRKLIAFSWFAALMDSLLLLGLSLIFCSSLFLGNRFGLNVSLSRDLFYELMMVVFIFLSCSYMIMLRSFLGFSLGEWACSLRLGSPSERLASIYGLRVLARVLVIFITGIITLPILSLLMGKDFAGKISGLKLYSLV